MRLPRIKPRRILAFTAGFALIATCALAGPGYHATPAKPPPNIYAPNTEIECAALALFLYNRAADRDRGMPRSIALYLTRQWDDAHGVEPTIRRTHELWIYRVYTLDALSPADIRQTYEQTCLTRPALQR